jgi:hypothetical protein
MVLRRARRNATSGPDPKKLAGSLTNWILPVGDMTAPASINANLEHLTDTPCGRARCAGARPQPVLHLPVLEAGQR